MPVSDTTCRLLGVDIVTRSLGELTGEAMAAIERGSGPLIFACANPHSLVVAQKDPLFHRALNSFDHVVADGTGLVVLGRLTRANIGPRITGMDYFLSLMTALNEVGGKRVFFLGSTDFVLERIRSRVKREFPNIAEVGALSPPFGTWSEDDKKQVNDRIRDFSPDVLWVGMTAPRQEKWMFENRDSLDVSLVGAIGAVFDFYAGTYRRAPLWMRKFGMEWLFRLILEPRRLWRRNFVSSPQFVVLLLKEKLFGGKR